jgi:hypothetical protein
MSAEYRNLSGLEWAELRQALDCCDLARRWGCSLSTMYRRLKRAKPFVLEEAKKEADKYRKELSNVATQQRELLQRHQSLSYVELTNEIQRLNNMRNRARYAPMRHYLVWLAVKTKTLDEKPKEQRCKVNKQN